MIHKLVGVFRQWLRCCKSLFSKSNNKTKIEGKIKFFDRKKKFGFITSGSKEYFFHASAASRSDFRLLKEGITVKFTVVNRPRGSQANDIEISK